MKRLFIVDPVCGQILGHNFTILTNLYQYFKSLSLFDDIICISNHFLDVPTNESVPVDPFFSYYYFDRMVLHDQNGRPRLIPDNFLEKDQVSVSRKDFESLFKKYQISSSDSIYFPSLDFYGVLGLVSFLESQNNISSPTLLFRFIGVMENATSKFRNPVRELGLQLRKLIAGGFKVKLSAESALYAQYLSRYFGLEVDIIPIPLFGSFIPLPDDKTFTVIMPGSGRIDKGFITAAKIISYLYKNHEVKNIRFRAQLVTSKEAKLCMEAIKTYYSLPFVELLPAIIDKDDIINLYKTSTLVLMPYDNGIYKYRSSAVFSEAIDYGRQIITNSGTGFEAEVRYFGTGTICSNIQEYVDAIVAYSEMSRADLLQRALHARKQYQFSVTAIYKGWFI